jgi:chitin deacetylase
MLLLSVILPSLVTLSSVHAHKLPAREAESHAEEGRLPSRWYHEERHPVHELFKRAPTTDGATYATVGSDGEIYASFRPT